MQLNELRTGDCGQILSVGGTGALRRRLMDMGLTPGAKIYIRKIAPLGDPIEVCIRGYELTLRKEDIMNIAVEKILNPGVFGSGGHLARAGMRRRRGFRGGRP